MLKRRSSRAGRWGVACLLALLAVSCGEVAELIPGHDRARGSDPAATAEAEPTPILISPTVGVGSPRADANQPTIPDHELARAVVQVLATDTTGGAPRVVRDGSGVVIDSSRRLILTSYAIVAPDRADGSLAYNHIIIATNRTPGSAPTHEFRAEVIAADLANGLAVLQVSARADGSSLTPTAFLLSEARMGDAARAGAGFELRLFGHPGLSTEAASQAVSVSRGTVLGLRGDDGHTGRTALKIDGTLPYGVAGGPAFDQSGSLMGILVQERYSPRGEVGQVRPADLASAMIEAAQRGNVGTELRPPLIRHALVPGTALGIAESDIWVSRPVFAENATEGGRTRDLFDYETRFPSGLPGLFYEYVLQGVPAAALVEERWYLDAVRQDTLSSSVAWDGRRFGIVSDRIAAPGSAGIPVGRWRLEVWVDGVMRATSTALVGVTLDQPELSVVGGGTTASLDGSIFAGPTSGASQLLAFFDFRGMEGVQRLQWVVFRDNQRVYISAPVQWRYGNNGRLWVGFRDSQPIRPGLYEFELQVDGEIKAVASIRVS